MYQPNLTRIGGALTQALYSKATKQHPWNVYSISQSQRSSSIYAYVWRQGRLGFLRFSNHPMSENNDAVVSVYVHRPDSSKAVYHAVKDHPEVSGQLNSQAIPLDLPALMILQAVAKTYKTSQTFLWHYGRLLVTHPQREITDRLIRRQVQRLLDFRLLICRLDGHLSVTHNGLNILDHYGSFVEKGWPWTLHGYSCDDLLFKLSRYLGHNIAQEAASASLDLPLEQVPTPKFWRSYGLEMAEKRDWYPYQILASVSPARRRSLYLYLYSPRLAKLAVMRIGVSELERTPVAGFPRRISNTLVSPTRRLQELQETISQPTIPDLLNNLATFRLHLLHFVWLRLIWWAEKHAVIEFDDENVIITKKDPDAESGVSYCLPKHQRHWITELVHFGLVDDQTKLRVTPLGYQVMQQYGTTRRYQASTWTKHLVAKSFDLGRLLNAMAPLRKKNY